jgi:hypothetical protein
VVRSEFVLESAEERVNFRLPTISFLAVR